MTALFARFSSKLEENVTSVSQQITKGDLTAIDVTLSDLKRSFAEEIATTI